jgi:phage terminase small subunit
MTHAALTPKQQRFVAEFLIDSNATQAAIRAGYSKRTAASQGSRLLSNAEIAASVVKFNNAAVKVAADKLEITAAKVLQDIEDLRVSALAADAFPSALRASELQGKTIGLFTDQVDINARTKGEDGNPQTALQLAREIAFALSVALRSAEATKSTPRGPDRTLAVAAPVTGTNISAIPRSSGIG